MDKELNTGIFTVSLDFELHWGVSDHRTVESYNANLKNTPQVVEQLLKVFGQHEIEATWAIVGMLFCENRNALPSYVTEKDRPKYDNKSLSNYRLVKEVGHDETVDPYHFALSLIQKIAQTKGQEIGTHTFSHYYCLETGQTLANYQADLAAAVKIASAQNCKTDSIIFPRNQYNNDHLSVLAEHGIRYYRGNEQHWMYHPRSRENETWSRKLARLIDSYIKISGDNTHLIDWQQQPINIPSSRFLRPYNATLAFLDGLRLNRICAEMTYAAQHKRLYHLWWHPHNFGKYQTENFAFLQKIIDHFHLLQQEYGFQSKNMTGIGQLNPTYVAQ